MKGLSKTGSLDFGEAIDHRKPQVEQVAPPAASKGKKNPAAKMPRSAALQKSKVDTVESGPAALDNKDLVTVQAVYDLKHGEPVTLAIHYLDGGIKAALAELGRSREDNLKNTVTTALREYLEGYGVKL